MNYANIKKFDIANGLGVRVSLFVSGCSHHCKGCFNEIAWDYNYGNEFNVDVEDEIIKALSDINIKGLTLLGGEPLDPKHQGALLPFIRRVKEALPEKDIWCYTGYVFEKDLISDKGRAKTEYTEDLLNCFDILVDGPFIEELKDITLKFRGSSNQRIIDLKKTLKEKKIILVEELMKK